jgi:pantoate--beta-alanine ligase
VLYQSLQSAKTLYESAFVDGLPISSSVLKDAVLRVLEKEPMVEEIQYVSIDCKDTMRPIDQVDTNGAIISIACKLGNVRLIDNIVL